MSLILSQWLSTDVKLTKQVPPDQLDSVFRNGFLLGQVLYKLKLNDDFHIDFVNSTTTDAAIKNYSSLERLLREKLGISLTAGDAIDLITAKQGSAAKLLHLIKCAHLQKTQITSIEEKNNPPIKKLSNLPPLVRSSSAMSYNGTADQVSLISKYQYQSPAKRQFNEQQERFFANLLRSKLKRGDVTSAPKIVPVKEKRVKRKPLIAEAREPTLSPTKTRNIPCWDDPIKVRALTPPSNGQTFVPPNPEALKQNIRGKIQLERQEKVIEGKKEIVDEFISNVDKFESKIIVQDEKEDEEAFSQKVKRFVTITGPMDPSTHLKTLKNLAPTSDVTLAQKQLARIRNKKHEEDIARKDREQKRRKLLLNEKKMQEEQETNNTEINILENISKLSKQERRIAEQLMATRNEKEQIISNRIYRQKQYDERRQLDYEQALEREHANALHAQFEYKQQTEMQLLQHFEILANKKANQHDKNVNNCRVLVNQLLNFSFKISEYRELNDKNEVPLKILRQWKTLFLNEQPLESKCDLEIEQDSIIVPDSDTKISDSNAINSSIQILDDDEFSSYIEGSSDWIFPKEIAEKVKEGSAPLASIIDTIFEITAVSISDNNISVNLPSVPLRISVIGKPFSGKASVVEKLASIYCLEIINIDALISLSIKDAEIESLDGKNSTRGEIGRKIQAFMIEGQIPSDSLLVQLIIDAVQKLNPQPPDEQPQKEKGWILMNFPRTRAQAVLLEKELTGYEEPKAIKLGNLKRNNNPVKEKEKTPAIATDKKPTVDRQRSMIAAPALDVKGEVKAGSIQSGIDVVFLLDVSNETAIKRAAGTRFDSITAEKYHLEFNPPPSDVIGIHERLTGYIDDANEIDLIQNQIFAFEEQEPLLKEWFQKFSNIHVIEGSTSAEEVMFGVFGHVTRLIESKEKIEREKTVEENPVSNNVGFPPAISQIDNVSSSNANLVKDSDESKRVAASAKTEDDKKTKPTSGNAKPVAPRAASGGKNRPITSVALGKDNGKKLDQSNAVVDPLTQFADGQALLVRSVTSDGRKLPTREIAEILADQWSTIESSYTDSIKFAFRCLRREREVMLRYFYSTKVSFREFLERPDRKQELVETFQKEFNLIEEDLRSDPDAKAELHQRAQDLREKLWEMSDIKREQAENERLLIIEDRWVEDHSALLSNVYLTAMQAELDRFYATRQLVTDYFRDSHSMILLDPFKPAPKISLLTTSSNPPIDVASTLSSAGGEKHKRDIASAGAGPMLSVSAQTNGKKQSIAPPGFNPSKKDKKNEKEPTIEKEDLVIFPELQVIIDGLLSGIVSSADHSTLDVDKNLKRKVEQGEKGEQEVEFMSPLFKLILDNEEASLKYRLERLASHLQQQLRHLRAKGLETYVLLDEWITARFQSEIDAIKILSNVVCDAVECETRLPNALSIVGDVFKIDFEVLTFELDAAPRPESPVEKSEGFTVLQLCNLSRQFALVAPNGWISCREFVDSVSRMRDLSSGSELLPEFQVKDAQLAQVCTNLDPYDTGFLNWQRYILLSSKILPTPSAEYMVYLKNQYMDLAVDGKLTRSDFMSVPLWFEDEEIPSEKFNRPIKLKQVLFYVFSRTIESKIVKDVEPEEALNDIVEETDPAKENVVDSENAQETQTEEEAPIESELKLASVSFQKEAIAFGQGGAHFLKEHEQIPDDGDLLDVNHFMLSLCLDETSRQGLSKAFNVVSTRSEYTLNSQEIYNLVKKFTFTIESTHRGIGSSDIFTLDEITRFFDEINKTGEAISAAEFSEMANVGSSPLFQIDDVPGSTKNTRPNSSK